MLLNTVKWKAVCSVISNIIEYLIIDWTGNRDLLHNKSIHLPVACSSTFNTISYSPSCKYWRFHLSTMFRNRGSFLISCASLTHGSFYAVASPLSSPHTIGGLITTGILPYLRSLSLCVWPAGLRISMMMSLSLFTALAGISGGVSGALPASTTKIKHCGCI